MKKILKEKRKLSKIGNSVGVRIPQSILFKLRIDKYTDIGKEVEIWEEDGKIIIDVKGIYKNN